MKLTKSKAVQEHRKMWNWIAGGTCVGICPIVRPNRTI